MKFPSYDPSPEQTLKVIAAWKASPELRAEFRGDFRTYHAYVELLVTGRSRNATLPHQLAGIFPGVRVADPPKWS